MPMKKIDLSKVIAVGHRDRDDVLEVLVENNDEFDYIEVAAPYEAYNGLRDLSVALSTTLSAALEPDVMVPVTVPAQLPAATNPVVNPVLNPMALTFDMRPVRSTMANAVGYNQDEQILQIEFKNGAVYQYDDVEPEMWTELWESDSIGIVFNESIRGHYSSKRCS